MTHRLLSPMDLWQFTRLTQYCDDGQLQWYDSGTSHDASSAHAKRFGMLGICPRCSVCPGTYASSCLFHDHLHQIVSSVATNSQLNLKLSAQWLTRLLTPLRIDFNWQSTSISQRAQAVDPIISWHHHQIVSSVVVSSQPSCTKCKSFRLRNGLADG